MFINYIILCVTASIDAIGIGISYGFRKTNIDNLSKIIISLIIYFSTFIGVTFGNFLSIFLPDAVLRLIGSIILICIGIFIILENIYPNEKKKGKKFIRNARKIIKDSSKADLDNSNSIDWKEAIYLAISVSIDAFSMGIYASTEDVNCILFSLCMTIIHLFFLILGKNLGKCIVDISKIKENFWKILSSILLIFIGIIKLIF